MNDHEHIEPASCTDPGDNDLYLLLGVAPCLQLLEHVRVDTANEMHQLVDGVVMTYSFAIGEDGRDQMGPFGCVMN